MKLYAVVTIGERTETRKDGSTYESTHDRCVAICETIERARKIIVHNQGDIFEYYYQYAVIETKNTDELYCGFQQDQYWYEWQGDGATGKYEPIERPDKYKNIVGWGIG